MFTPEKTFIHLYECNNEGHTNTNTSEKKHKFIILSSKDYNTQSNCILAIPLTTTNNQYTNNYGYDLNIDDFEGRHQLPNLQETFILCDRPCRIKKEDLVKVQDYGKIKAGTLLKIAHKVKKFIEEYN